MSPSRQNLGISICWGNWAACLGGKKKRELIAQLPQVCSGCLPTEKADARIDK